MSGCRRADVALQKLEEKGAVGFPFCLLRWLQIILVLLAALSLLALL
jgi:hypothetical protein